MLTKVSLPNDYATTNIKNFIIKYNINNSLISRIQDNMEGYLLIKYSDGNFKMYNYYVNKFYSHNKIQVYFNSIGTTKQIDSFDQNNLTISSKIRSYVIKTINYYNTWEFKINSILGIGGEYYLYWKYLLWIKEFNGISNHESIVSDANLLNLLPNKDIFMSYLVDYNNKKTYPKILSSDIVLINLSSIHNNVIEYIGLIQFKKIIMISCELPKSKLDLLKKKFKIIKIKYFKNFNGLIRIIQLEKKNII